MNIYIPGNIRKLPFIDVAIKLLDQFNSDYELDVSEFQGNKNEIDSVKKFLQLFYVNIEGFYDDVESGEDSDTSDSTIYDKNLDTTKFPNFGSYMVDLDGVINYIAENFYLVKGTPAVISLLYRFGYLDKQSTVEYNGKSLRITLNNTEGEYITLYSSDLFISRLKDFFNTLLYYETIEIVVVQKVIRIDCGGNNEVSGEITPRGLKYGGNYYIIEKQ